MPEQAELNGQALHAEIVRLNKIIQALMNRAERNASVQSSDFNLFQTAIILEEQVRRRTDELNAALKENEKITRTLRESENHNRLLVENSPMCIHEIDLDGKITSMNRAGLDMLGVKEESEVQGFLYLNAVSVADRERIGALLGKAYAGETSHFEFKASGPRGQIYKSCFVPIKNKNGIVEKLMGITEDITERKRTEENLRITASVFSSSQEGIVIADANNEFLDVNPAFTQITGYTREEVIGKNPKVLSSGRQDKAFYAAMWQSLQQKKAWRGEIWNRRKSGEIYAELLSIAVICDDEGRVQRYVGVFSDISYLKTHEAELSLVANYDALTGIPNRRLQADRMDQAIARAQRSGRMLSVCYIDLDGFKQVNDQYGHEAGDQLLVEVTRRMQEALRAGDTLARLGGDEFVVLFNDLASTQECYQILDRILQIVAMPVLIGSHTVTVSASIGVTFHSSANEDGDTLLRHADQAMYIAKQTGKSRYHLHGSERD
jgi:diguanylate cyclase (GGDEF)-like protein/PAS domain S-box-containing protein